MIKQIYPLHEKLISSVMANYTHYESCTEQLRKSQATLLCFKFHQKNHFSRVMLTSSNLACSVHISLRISVLPIRRMLTAWSFGGFDPGLLVHVIFGQLLNSLLPLTELAQIKVMLGIPFLDNATAFIYPPRCSQLWNSNLHSLVQSS